MDRVKVLTTELLVLFNAKAQLLGFDHMVDEDVIEQLDDTGVHVIHTTTVGSEDAHVTAHLFLKYSGIADPQNAVIDLQWQDWHRLPEAGRDNKGTIAVYDAEGTQRYP